MKRLFTFLSFILFTIFFVAADTQKQQIQNGDDQVRPHSSSRMSQFHSRKTPSISQPSPSEWARVYYERAENLLIYSILESNNNDGYFVTGRSPGEGADYHQWIYRLSPEGDVERKYMDLYPDGPVTEIHSIQKTFDGGYVTTGRYAPPSSVGPGFGVIKFSQQFDIEWARDYNGPFYENPWSIQQTSEGGYILAGITKTFVDPVSDHANDIWVLKLSSIGDVEWEKSYGGLGFEAMSSSSMVTILQTNDGGYIFACDTDSFGAGQTDFWLVKLTSTGDIEWQKTYGGAESEWFSIGGPHIQLSNDGGYVVAGNTLSFGAGYTDVWVLKISSTGDVEWQKTYGGEYADFVNAIQPTFDGGYVIAGGTASFGVGGSPGSWTPDFWLLKISADGDIELQKAYGGAFHDEAYCIQQTSDEGYIMAGRTNSFEYDRYTMDTLILKISKTGEIGPGYGLIEVNSSDAVVLDTDVLPQDTMATPRVANGATLSADPIFAERELLSEVVAWPFHQPPIITGFKSEPDRGLTKGIRMDEITGEMHPWNIQHNFDDDIERIIAYWKYADEGYTSYREISDVVLHIDTFEFQNEILDPREFTKARHYAFATETSQGVSPKSPPVGGAIDTSQTSKSSVSSSSKKITQKDAAVQSKSSQDILVKSEQPSRSDKQFQKGIQPPMNITVTRGENSQIIRWGQNPLNNPESVSGYQVYRVWGEGDDTYYEFIGWVPSKEYEFVDYAWDSYKKLRYAVSAVDVDYKESSKSLAKKVG